MLKLFNTLSRQKEVFRPLKGNKVGLYTCGPTVYNYAHLGNLRTYIFEDLLKRVLLYNGYRVKHVMNITDVGHLTSDADTGEDKMEESAQKEKRSPQEIANFYTDAFKQNLKNLNIFKPDIWCKATGHITEQIDLIKKLEQKGFTYQIDDGVYFDTSKLKNYGQLTKQNLADLKAGSRVEMVAGKKNSTDFALWKFSPPTGANKNLIQPIF
jgi:cysteinyl-tRNA synthetase